MATLNGLGATNFTIPLLKSFFETGNARFFEDVQFGKGDKVRNVVFEEEFVSVPTIVASDFSQATNPEQQDNIEILPVQPQQVVPEEQIQQAPEQGPLRRSI